MELSTEGALRTAQGRRFQGTGSTSLNARSPRLAEFRSRHSKQQAISLPQLAGWHIGFQSAGIRYPGDSPLNCSRHGTYVAAASCTGSQCSSFKIDVAWQLRRWQVTHSDSVGFCRSNAEETYENGVILISS